MLQNNGDCFTLCVWFFSPIDSLKVGLYVKNKAKLYTLKFYFLHIWLCAFSKKKAYHSW